MTLQARPTRAPLAAGGTYIGTVTRVTGTTCYVELPDIAPGAEYGPARYPAQLAAGAVTTGAASAGTAHTHPLGAALTVGDAVVVTFLTAVEDALVVLARLA